MSSPRAKWYQFSLKSWFVLITVGAIWIAVHYARVGRYQATVAALREAGATLQFTGPHGGNSIVPERVLAVNVPAKADAAEIIGIARALPDLPRLNLARSNVQDADLAMLASYPALMSVNLDSTRITEAGLSLLEKVKTLKTVYIGDTYLAPNAIRALQDALPGCRVSARILQPLSKVQHEALREILEGGGHVSYDQEGDVQNISWEPLDEKRFALITMFPTIRHWSLTFGPHAPDITDAWLERLGRMDVIESLSFRGTEVSDRGLSSLAGLTDLQSLDFAAGAATGERVRPWRSMPTLTRLSIEGARLTTLEFIDPESFKNLRRLRLKCPKLKTLPRLDWASLGELEVVDLECPELKGEDVACMMLPESVESIFFSRMSLDRSSFATISEARHLSRLILRNCYVTHDGWDGVRGLPGPTQLFLRGTLPPDGRIAGEMLSAFTDVWISDVELADAHLDALAAMPALTSLSIERCDLSMADATILANCDGLESLHFTSTPITQDIAEMLRRMLPECEIQIK